MRKKIYHVRRSVDRKSYPRPLSIRGRWFRGCSFLYISSVTPIMVSPSAFFDFRRLYRGGGGGGTGQRMGGGQKASHGGPFWRVFDKKDGKGKRLNPSHGHKFRMPLFLGIERRTALIYTWPRGPLLVVWGSWCGCCFFVTLCS